MKNQNKYNVFKPMSDAFETDLMKSYFLDMVQEIPDYIFTMPSSTTGKYHNKTQEGQKGSRRRDVQRIYR